MTLLFISTPLFDRGADALIGDQGVRQVQAQLLQNPRAGAVIEGTGGVRKLRVALPGRGRRGSARLLYLFIEPRSAVYLLLLYEKSKKDDLAEAEKKAVREIVRKLRGE